MRAVLIRGAGKGFSSGADLKGGSMNMADDGKPDILHELHEVYHPILRGVRQLEKPVVAAVHGAAAGIGCSLALSCDLILAGESSFFTLAFVNIGLMADGGSTLFVPAAVGKARAFEMAFLGERVPAPAGAATGGWSTPCTPTTSCSARPRAWWSAWRTGRRSPTRARRRR